MIIPQLLKETFLTTAKGGKQGVRKKVLVMGNASLIAMHEDIPEIYQAVGPANVPIVIDTGASISITPNKTDFIGEIVQLPNSNIRGLNSTTKIAGVGRIGWTLKDASGEVL